MAKVITLSSCLLLFFYLKTSAQNLIPNPSFEELRNLPVKDNPKNTFEYEPKSGYIPYMQNLKFWFAATETTPDLRISSRDDFARCRKLYKNCDKARTGDNCVGIITFLSNSTTDTYREYLQIKLREPLQPGDSTFVELWVSKERQAKLISNNIGLHFSMKKTSEFILGNLKLEPQINIDSLMNMEKKEWVKLQGVFVPDKPFKYLLIGNFYENEKTQVVWFENYNGRSYVPPYAYYLIDDIRVWQVENAPDTLLYFNDQVLAFNEPIALKHVEFEFDSAQLQDTSFVELEQLFQLLTKNPKLKIALQGHTDADGSDLYNQVLSENRAKSVRNYLLKQGIAEDRLSVEGLGESLPLRDNTTKEGRSRNRRVEFLILDH